MDEPGEGGHHTVLAMVYEDPAGLFRKMLQPVQQPRLVRMAALAGHGAYFGIHRHLFIEELHRLHTAV